MKIDFTKQDKSFIKIGSMFVLVSALIFSIPLIYFGLDNFMTKELKDFMAISNIVNELGSLVVFLINCIIGIILFSVIIIGCEIGCEIVNLTQQKNQEVMR